MEKSILRELVDDQKHVLEGKKNDFLSIKKKSEAWDELAEKFNSQQGVNKRDAKSLKKCWENIKARSKKIISKENKVEDAQAVAAIIPAQVNSLENQFDDDATDDDEIGMYKNYNQ